MRIPENRNQKYWISKSGLDPNTQWVQLTFPVPVIVRTVRLYDIPSADSSINVQAATVKLFSDAQGTNLVGSNTSGALSENGTDVTFNEVTASVVRVEMNSVTGGAAALAEVEVIARAGEGGNQSPTVTPAGTQVTTTPTALSATPATATYTFTPTAVNAVTATSTFTFTPTAINASPAPPTSAFTPTVTIPSATSTIGVIASPTMIVLSSPTSISTANPTGIPPVVPSIDPNATTLPPMSIQTERGSTQGSLASLGTLTLSGADDNPGEYVSFRPDGKYSGTLAFPLPANIQPSGVSSLTLQVNFKGTSTSRQNWIWSIYDWNTKKWVKLGTAAGHSRTPWQLLKFETNLLPSYISSGREIRIQLRSNNGNGEARIDYQILQLTLGSTPSRQALPLSPVTLTPSPSPTSLPPSPSSTPQE
jgi:hypothetical protein